MRWPILEFCRMVWRHQIAHYLYKHYAYKNVIYGYNWSFSTFKYVIIRFISFLYIKTVMCVVVWDYHNIRQCRLHTVRKCSIHIKGTLISFHNVPITVATLLASQGCTIQPHNLFQPCCKAKWMQLVQKWRELNGQFSETYDHSFLVNFDI